MGLGKFLRGAGRSRFFWPGIAIGVTLGLFASAAAAIALTSVMGSTAIVRANTSDNPPLAPQSIVVPYDGLIVFEGDSLTYGLDASSEGSTAHEINNSNQPRSPRPFPETLQTMLGRRVRVENHGFPGDRSIDGVYRWVDPSTPALTVLMYGTNDGDVRAPTARQVPVSEFRAALTLMVERRLATGSRVVIMPPPPLGAWDRSAAIEPYRVAARQVARAEGVFLVEPASILSNVNQPFTPDSVHLTPAANDAIAAYFSKVIDVRS